MRASSTPSRFALCLDRDEGQNSKSWVRLLLCSEAEKATWCLQAHLLCLSCLCLQQRPSIGISSLLVIQTWSAGMRSELCARVASFWLCPWIPNFYPIYFLQNQISEMEAPIGSPCLSSSPWGKWSGWVLEHEAAHARQPALSLRRNACQVLPTQKTTCCLITFGIENCFPSLPLFAFI